MLANKCFMFGNLLFLLIFFFFFKVQPLLKGSSYEHQFFFQGDGYIISLVE